MEGTGEINEQTRRWVQKENGERSHLSDGRKWRWGKAVEQEKVSSS